MVVIPREFESRLLQIFFDFFIFVTSVVGSLRSSLEFRLACHAYGTFSEVMRALCYFNENGTLSCGTQMQERLETMRFLTEQEKKRSKTNGSSSESV